MAAKYGADPAWWKHLDEQQKLVALLRENGAPPAQLEKLEQCTHSACCELARTYFTRKDDTPLKDERALLIFVLLARLTPRRREAFRLYRVERLGYAQIATLLNVKIDTVKDDLTEALLVFADELQQRETERSRREDHDDSI
jgi:RNA polymerase sigma factor (sigma-70 family)